MTVTGDRGDKPYDCLSLPRSQHPGCSTGRENASRGWEDAWVEEMELRAQSPRADSSQNIMPDRKLLHRKGQHSPDQYVHRQEARESVPQGIENSVWNSHEMGRSCLFLPSQTK